MQKPIFSLIVALFTYASSFAQAYALGDSKIEVEVSINNQVIYIHKIQKDQTIYSLARYFKIPVQDLMLINDITTGQIISIGSEIKIPIDRNKLQTPLEKRSDEWVPIIYKVKKGETLYSMANSYFPQRMEHLIARNEIQSFYVRSDQELVIGWWGDDVEAEVDFEVLTEAEVVADAEIESGNENDVQAVTEFEVITETKIETEAEVAAELSLIEQEQEIVKKDLKEAQIESETGVNTQANDNNTAVTNINIVPKSEPIDDSYKEEYVLDIITQVMNERDNPHGRTTSSNIEAPKTIETPSKIEAKTANTTVIKASDRRLPDSPAIDLSAGESAEPYAVETAQTPIDEDGNSEENAEDISAESSDNSAIISETDNEENISETIDSLATTTTIVKVPVAKYRLVTKSKTGIGLWDKNDPDATNLYVFHRTAKINSLVKLHNPVTNRTVTAEVIGHILDKIYSPDIDVVVTRGVAVKLGAMDSRFRVDIDYTEKILN